MHSRFALHILYYALLGQDVGLLQQLDQCRNSVTIEMFLENTSLTGRGDLATFVGMIKIVMDLLEQFGLIMKDVTLFADL